MASIALLLFITGCETTARNTVIRYQAVEIPRYNRQDYVNLLKNHDPVLQYLGLCNLIPDAAEIGKTLNGGPGTNRDSIASGLYQESSNILSRVISFLGTRNEQLVTASLVFSAEILSSLTNQGPLIKAILRIQSRNRTIAFEILNVLGQIHHPGPKERNLLSGQIRNPDKLLSSKALSTINYRNGKDLGGTLRELYGMTRDETEQILILNSLLRIGGHENVPFARNGFKTEMADNRKAGLFLALLADTDSANSVASLLGTNSDRLDWNVQKTVIESYKPATPEGIEFFTALIAGGFDLYSIYTNPPCFREFVDALLKTNTPPAVLDSLKKLDLRLEADTKYASGWGAAKKSAELEARKKRTQASLDGKNEKVIRVISRRMEKNLEETRKDFVEAGLTVEETELALEQYSEFMRMINESITNK